jgi:cellulose synthase/poly-beta-1,6-N-acetylglucosamine synthase-like glycosyltransferase
MWDLASWTPIVDWGVLSYFVGLQTFYTLLIVLAILEIARHQAERLPELDTAVLFEESTPPITILVPAHNEERHVVDTVRSLMDLEYPDVEILVINDGSTDETLQRLEEAFDLEAAMRPVRESIPTAEICGLYQSSRHEDVWVLDKVQGGKPDALNAGINVTRTPIVCSVDADTVVVRDGLLRMVEPFIHDPNEVVAVGGTVRVANGCDIDNGIVREVGVPDSWLARFQLVEYLRAYIFGRLGLNRLGGNLIISGAFGLFSRKAVVDVGGYDTDTDTEDMDLVVKLHRYVDRHGGRVAQMSDPIAYTEVPESLGGLATQRSRWHRGLAQTLWKHRAMIGRPRHGLAGMLVMPLFVLFELLGPVVELFGYGWFALAVVFGFADPAFAVAFLIVAVLWGMLLTLVSLVADRWTYRPGERETGGAVMFVVALLENFGYRQLTMFFRLKGLLGLLTGQRGWGSIERRGHGRQPAAPATPTGTNKEQS